MITYHLVGIYLVLICIIVLQIMKYITVQRIVVKLLEVYKDAVVITVEGGLFTGVIATVDGKEVTNLKM